MIQLAANFSPTLEKLLPRVNPPLDHLKLPLGRDVAQELERACQLRPVLLHGWGPEYRLGMPEIPEPKNLVTLIERSQTPWLSVHLDIQPEDLNNPTPQQTLQRLRQSAQQLQDLTTLPLLLENMPHYAWSERPLYISEPAFISQVVNETNSKFLLDIAHARIAAHHRQQAIEDHLLALPLAHCQEIHVSGPRLEQDGLRDRHLALQAQDYELLLLVLQHAPNVQMITLEYGGIPDQGQTCNGQTLRLNRNDPAQLLEMLAKLDTIRRQHNGTNKTASRLPLTWHIDRHVRETRWAAHQAQF